MLLTFIFAFSFGLLKAQEIRQILPIPLPMGMGGTGNTTGAQAGQSTVSTLPTCNATTKGQIFFVTDSLLPALGTAIAGGGTVNVLVFCSGTTWFPG
jgi:hypothetical protein